MLGTKHKLVDRDKQNQNGLIVPNIGVYVLSGSSNSIEGSTTGSLTFNIDTIAAKLLRIQVYHSGSASNFHLSLDSKLNNSGSNFDPRNIAVLYDGIPGSTDFHGGIDQVEDLVILTDSSSNNEGNLYLKLMPYGSGGNVFKYLIFLEAIMIYRSSNV